MNELGYYVNITLHVLAAILWLGGMFFLAIVGAPVLRSVDPPSLRAQLFRQVGRRFRTIGWIAIGVLLVTGVANLAFHGLLHTVALGDGEFWTSRYGHAFAVKLVCVVLMLLLSALHDFVLGPRSSRLEPGSPAARANTRYTAWIARANVILGVLLIIAAVRLARG